MQFPQLQSRDGRVELKVGLRRATLVVEGRRTASFDAVHEERLTLGRVHELEELGPGILVAFAQASPQARTALREAGISYASRAGEMYVHAPPVHVEVAAERRGAEAGWGSTPGPSLFALRGSRIPRWLLLNPEAAPTFSELAEAVELSASNVSRTAHALAEEGLVAVEPDSRDARSRRLRVRSPGPLLDALEEGWRRRRLRSVTLDVGARDPQAAAQIVRRAAARRQLKYAVGGLVGAERLVKAVQPAALTAWVAAGEASDWEEELDAYYAPRPGPGTVTVTIAPDPYTLSLAFEREGLSIADPVQLYLDCGRSGERALEAAAAIRAEMGW